MTIEKHFFDLGINITANCLYDIIKKIFQKKPNYSNSDFKQELQEAFLEIKGAKINSHLDTFIKILTNNGIIIIKKSEIYANDEILLDSSNGKFYLEDTSIKTKLNSIELKEDAYIEGKNGSKIILSKYGITISA